MCHDHDLIFCLFCEYLHLPFMAMGSLFVYIDCMRCIIYFFGLLYFYKSSLGYLSDFFTYPSSIFR
jgi:hypothetical protein